MAMNFLKSGFRLPGMLIGCARIVNTLLFGAIAIVVLHGIPIATAHAAFIDQGGNQDVTQFGHQWAWDFANGPVNPSVVAGPNWHRQVTSAGGGAVDFTITMDWAHLPPPPHPGIDVPRNPPLGLHSLAMAGISRAGISIGGGNRVPALAVAVQFTHETAVGNPPHYDVVSLSVNAPPVGAASVRGQGVHNDATLATWSYTPFEKGTIEVFASYDPPQGNVRVQGPRTVDPGNPPMKPGKPGGYVENTLTPANAPPNPTDYIVRFTRNPTTELTLAFPGTVDGVPGRLDLVAGFDLFGGIGGEILVPMFLDAASSSTDLFIGVDLVQWLSFPAPINPFDEFEIVGGVSAGLPGFTFSRSSLMTNANGGFLPSDPFDGRVYAAGIVDGRTVPEPSTFLLLASSLPGFYWILRRRPKQPGMGSGLKA